MSKVTQAIKEQKSTIFWFKLTNLLLDYPFLGNNVNTLKVAFKAICEFQKEGIQAYKKLNEIDEQLDENERELKNILGEILKKINLFLLLRKINKCEKVKNDFIKLFVLTQDYLKIFESQN